MAADVPRAKITRTLVALDTGVAAETVRQSLPVDGDISVVGVIDGLDDAWQTLQETAVDLVLVACAGYSDRTLHFIEGAVREGPDRPVVVLCEGSPNGFVRRVFEVGADDLVRLPEASDEVYFALQKAVARKQGAAVASGATSAPLICVLGPKGGTGKTLTVSNLGVALAQDGHRVAAVDLDLQFGDLGLTLGTTPDRTMFDLTKTGGNIDAEKLEAYLVEHVSGLRLLLAPSRPDQASVITVGLLREVYAALRSTHDYVLVDTPPGFTPEVISTIDTSTNLVVVGMLDSLSLKNTKLGLETLDLMGYDPNRIKILLNRADSRVGINPEDVEAVLGRAPDVLVPSDREIPRALNEGVTIMSAKPDSDASKAFRRLARDYERASAEASGVLTPRRRKRMRRMIGGRS
jgi:pilus assembly protein CpaE